MAKSANPFRVTAARSYGAEVVIAGFVAEAFQKVEEIRTTEGRTFIHPFEGKHTFAGAGTLGLEFLKQAGRLDAVIVPVGGGGLYRRGCCRREDILAGDEGLWRRAGGGARHER